MKAAVFDMDGTLINSMPALTELAVDNMVRYFGISRREALLHYERTVGIPYEEQLEKLFPNAKTTVRLAASDYAKKKWQLTLDAPVFPIMRAILKAVPEMGGVAGLVSSTDETLVQQIVDKNFSGLLDWKGGYRPGYRKPDQVLSFMQAFSLTRADRIFYYGDSKEDERIAFMYNMEFVKVEGCLAYL